MSCGRAGGLHLVHLVDDLSKLLTQDTQMVDQIVIVLGVARRGDIRGAEKLTHDIYKYTYYENGGEVDYPAGASQFNRSK